MVILLGGLGVFSFWGLGVDSLALPKQFFYQEILQGNGEDCQHMGPPSNQGDCSIFPVHLYNSYPNGFLVSSGFQIFQQMFRCVCSFCSNDGKPYSSAFANLS